jgi:LuxR family transcriptional regulator of spore coat protein
MNNILTKREHQIFNLLIQNKTTKEISKILNISEKTTRNHISNVIQKIGVNSRTQALVELIKLKCIKI